MPDIKITSATGEQWTFKDQDHPRVKFGRDPEWSDIQLPEEWRNLGVGREHCELVASAGCYSLEMNDRNRVWVDNKPAFDGDILPKQCTLSLLPNNPDASFQIESLFDTAGETVYFDAPEKRETRLIKKLAFSMLVFILSVFVVWSWWSGSQGLTEQEHLQIENSIFTVQTSTPEKITHAGTAWLAAENVVLTNRHVAELVVENLKWQSDGVPADAFIRLRSNNNQEGETIKITEVVYHPGEKLWQAYRLAHPMRHITEQTLQLDVYDIAQLKLERPIEAVPLELATDEEVNQLKLGQPLMIKGFPLNSGETSWDIFRPVPETKIGSFDRLRNVYVTEGVRESNPILSYNIETRGGNSGSPVMTMAGKVVGIHFASDKKLVNSASPSDGTNSSAAKGVLVDGWNSYGQHVRLIRQLTSGTAFMSNFESSEQAYWQHWLDSVPSLQDYRIAQIQQKTGVQHLCSQSFRGSWKDFRAVTSEIRRKSNWLIDLPKAKMLYGYIQSLSPGGERIYVSAHTANASFNLYQSQYYFDFETQLPDEISELDLTLGGPNREAEWMINLFLFANEPCDSAGFEVVQK